MQRKEEPRNKKQHWQLIYWWKGGTRPQTVVNTKKITLHSCYTYIITYKSAVKLCGSLDELQIRSTFEEVFLINVGIIYFF